MAFIALFEPLLYPQIRKSQCRCGAVNFLVSKWSPTLRGVCFKGSASPAEESAPQAQLLLLNRGWHDRFEMEKKKIKLPAEAFFVFVWRWSHTAFSVNPIVGLRFCSRQHIGGVAFLLACGITCLRTGCQSSCPMFVKMSGSLNSCPKA